MLYRSFHHRRDETRYTTGMNVNKTMREERYIIATTTTNNIKGIYGYKRERLCYIHLK